MDERMSVLTRLRIPRKDAEGLAEVLRPCVLAPGETLRASDGPNTDPVFLVSGLASVVCPDKGGVEVGIVAAPGFVGVEPMLPGWATSCIAIAATRVRGFTCPAWRLQAACEISPGLRTALADRSGQFMSAVLKRAACHAVHGAEARLATWLLVMYQASRESLTMTHDVVARRLGVRRPTVTTAMHFLEANGAVRARRAHIDIRDPLRLLHCSCRCHDYVEADFLDPSELTPADVALGAAMAASCMPTSRRAHAC